VGFCPLADSLLSPPLLSSLLFSASDKKDEKPNSISELWQKVKIDKENFFKLPK